MKYSLGYSPRFFFIFGIRLHDRAEVCIERARARGYSNEITRKYEFSSAAF